MSPEAEAIARARMRRQAQSALGRKSKAEGNRARRAMPIITIVTVATLLVISVVLAIAGYIIVAGIVSGFTVTALTELHGCWKKHKLQR